MNKIISSAIAVSAITVSTVFGLSLVNVNSSKAGQNPLAFFGKETRLRKTGTKFVTGKTTAPVHICKSVLKGSECKYSKTVKYTHELTSTGKVDLQMLSAESGFKSGSEYSETVEQTLKLEPNQGAKIYVAPTGNQTTWEYQEEKQKGQWVTIGKASVTIWSGVKINSMRCTRC
ncbi:MULTISPECIES: hypothetical protein [unclassified Anabaena]|jgi:hypothetical protein|uniref:hypothetical protein n=1 Tax=unclassified Anabaena TaxID=2619674 RepID=UPI0006AC212B|nr:MULTISPECIES: hypothetical protein [unclassified Anabaena]ALB42181.1 hypothetical protein AA650_18505 [Anabaena sp. WA102]MCX5982980.1 hypothetical protein [Nostocales cyanobacterium LacPavin_0920_SED1_MAG_38_18]OBQ22271.1 MAG: hypothetical protein AN486_02500 [Anabaena sp. AL93]